MLILQCHNFNSNYRIKLSHFRQHVVIVKILDNNNQKSFKFYSSLKFCFINTVKVSQDKAIHF